ncbi:MAG: hypothetical protein J0M09_07610 [Xanthomonadales bacterium]|nr:hypothetical protein [Xanthomonadales bacterium]
MVRFLKRLRKAFKSSEAICVDLRKVKRAVAGGTLLFFSELHRLKTIYPNHALRCIPPRDNTVSQVFKHLKIFDAFNHSSRVQPVRDDVVNWRSATSDVIDGKLVGGTLSAYESLKGEKSKLLYRGATEAMNNVVDHAYIQDRNDGLPSPPKKSWWLFCMEDEENAVVAVCDLGIGIPRSLPLIYPAELIRAAAAKITRGKIPADSAMIVAAMRLARTRTDVRGRGKGLPDARAIVDAVPGGKLYIFSNKGLLEYSNRTYTRKDYTLSIKGTVVIWLVPIKGLEDESDIN